MASSNSGTPHYGLPRADFTPQQRDQQARGKDPYSTSSDDSSEEQCRVRPGQAYVLNFFPIGYTDPCKRETRPFY
jgi:hypothetical protein